MRASLVALLVCGIDNGAAYNIVPPAVSSCGRVQAPGGALASTADSDFDGAGGVSRTKKTNKQSKRAPLINNPPPSSNNNNPYIRIQTRGRH